MIKNILLYLIILLISRPEVLRLVFLTGKLFDSTDITEVVMVGTKDYLHMLRAWTFPCLLYWPQGAMSFSLRIQTSKDSRVYLQHFEKYHGQQLNTPPHMHGARR